MRRRRIAGTKGRCLPVVVSQEGLQFRILPLGRCEFPRVDRLLAVDRGDPREGVSCVVAFSWDVLDVGRELADEVQLSRLPLVRCFLGLGQREDERLVVGKHGQLSSFDDVFEVQDTLEDRFEFAVVGGVSLLRRIQLFREET